MEKSKVIQGKCHGKAQMKSGACSRNKYCVSLIDMSLSGREEMAE